MPKRALMRRNDVRLLASQLRAEAAGGGERMVWLSERELLFLLELVEQHWKTMDDTGKRGALPKKATGRK